VGDGHSQIVHCGPALPLRLSAWEVMDCGAPGLVSGLTTLQTKENSLGQTQNSQRAFIIIWNLASVDSKRFLNNPFIRKLHML
jgi:hypothetical protein